MDKEEAVDVWSALLDKKTKKEQHDQRVKVLEGVKRAAERAAPYLTPADKQAAAKLLEDAKGIKPSKLPFLLAYAAGSTVQIEPKTNAKIVAAAEACLVAEGMNDALVLREPLSGATSDEVMASFEECLAFIRDNGAPIDVTAIIADVREQIKTQVPQMPVMPSAPTIPTADAIQQHMNEMDAYRQDLARYLQAWQTKMSIVEFKQSITDCVTPVLLNACAQIAARVPVADTPKEMFAEIRAFLNGFKDRYPLVYARAEEPLPKADLVEPSVRALFGEM